MLAANGITINLSKCTFMVPELEVLGHIIKKSGTALNLQHIQVIIEYPPPQGPKQLQRYLGMVNFFRRFTPGTAAVLEPLTAALKGGNKTLEWTLALDSAFQVTATGNAVAVPPAHPAPNAATRPTTTSAAHSNNKYMGPGNRWVSFLTSYSMQN
jgi:hypothetical protein